MSMVASMSLLSRCSVSGRSLQCSATRARLASLSARAPAGSRLHLSAQRPSTTRSVSCAAEDSSKEGVAKAEAAEAEIVEEGAPGPEANGTETEDEKEEEAAPEEATPSGYSALLANLKSAIDDAADPAEAISALEAEFVGMTEEVNVAKANAKAMEVTALAAKEQFLRSQADFDNFRKRSQQEKDSLKSSVKGDVVAGFLPLVDNFELASKQLVLETEGEKKIDASYQGLYRQMVEIFKTLGVTAVETVGKPFNPELHEAIMQEPSDEVEDGAILDEFRRGFMLGDKLLRPAMVKVAINDSPAAASSSEDEAPPAEEAKEVTAEKKEAA